MADYGRQIIGNTGIPVFVEADGQGEYSPIGITLDWTTVVAPGADVLVMPQGLTVKAGQKYLQFGQILTRITNTPVQTLTLTGATGGTFTLNGYRTDTGVNVTTGALAYNITTAALLAALQAPTMFGPTPITVTGTPGASYVITSPLSLMTVNGAALTGTTPTAALVLTTAVGNYGYYGPYDPTASDGRQTLTRGQVKILNNIVLQNGIMGNVTNLASNHPGVLIGGCVWKARLIATLGTASLAAGPTFAALEAVMPRLTYAGSFPGP